MKPRTGLQPRGAPVSSKPGPRAPPLPPEASGSFLACLPSRALSAGRPGLPRRTPPLSNAPGEGVRGRPAPHAPETLEPSGGCCAVGRRRKPTRAERGKGEAAHGPRCPSLPSAASLRAGGRTRTCPASPGSRPEQKPTPRRRGGRRALRGTRGGRGGGGACESAGGAAGRGLRASGGDTEGQSASLHSSDRRDQSVTPELRCEPAAFCEQERWRPFCPGHPPPLGIPEPFLTGVIIFAIFKSSIVLELLLWYGEEGEEGEVGTQQGSQVSQPPPGHLCPVCDT